MVRPSSAGRATLSTTLRLETRLGNWNTKPIPRERTVARSASCSFQISVLPMSTLPSLGSAKAPSIASSVDLPEPERPTIETNSPAASSRLAPRTAW